MPTNRYGYAISYCHVLFSVAVISGILGTSVPETHKNRIKNLWREHANVTEEMKGHSAEFAQHVSIILLECAISNELYLQLAALIIAFSLIPVAAFAQSSGEYLILKSDRSETFALPYTAANRDLDDPLVYEYDEPKTPSWILSIRNNLSYVPGADSKIVIRIQEPAPSEKFIELVMFGGEFRRYLVSVNLPEIGYQRLYSNDVNGWSLDGPVAVAHGENVGLTVSDGKRTILDRFNLEGFAVGSISVYGRENATSPAVASGGDITFDILFGAFQDSPVYIVPAAIMAGVGALIVGLLVVKKRKPSD
jgi:hypothetical protein